MGSTTREARDVLEFEKPSAVDRLENGTIVLRRVKYCGARSTNRNRDGTFNEYPTRARAAAETKYDGAKVFANHPDRKTPGASRRVQDQLGRLRPPFVHEAEGSYADLHVHPKHPLAESVAWSADHSPDDFGLSHNAVITGKAKGTAYVTESVDKVRSVDLVCSGATTRSLLEDEHEESNVDLTKLREALEGVEHGAKALKVLEALDDEQTSKLVALLSDTATSPEEKVMAALAMLASAAMGEEPGNEGGDEGVPGAPAEEGAREGETKPADLAAGKLAALEAEVEKLKTEKATAERRERRLSELGQAKLRQEQIDDRLWADVLEEEDDAKAADRIKSLKRLAFHQPVSSGGGRREVVEGSQPELRTAEDFRKHLIG